MRKNKLLLVPIIAASILLPAIAGAASPEKIDPRDKPYYIHGPSYWEGDTQMVWQPGAPGMWGHRWVHGIYIQGKHRKPDANRPKETTKTDANQPKEKTKASHH